MANELLELGLVERGSHPTNRRIRLVQLVQADWDVVRAYTQELPAREQRLTELIGEDLGNSIVGVLDHASRRMELGRDERGEPATNRLNYTA